MTLAAPRNRSPSWPYASSAAYLGGNSLAELAAAGLVTEHTPGSLVSASLAFGWHCAPVADWVFKPVGNALSSVADAAPAPPVGGSLPRQC